mmetsp:Transcript_86670/g.181619  ORF Transcript_86670/g.181619 Transcript_86670/m.181619 type:complete len:242 (+) Transcript_86670:956-1681(+)
MVGTGTTSLSTLSPPAADNTRSLVGAAALMLLLLLLLLLLMISAAGAANGAADAAAAAAAAAGRSVRGGTSSPASAASPASASPSSPSAAASSHSPSSLSNTRASELPGCCRQSACRERCRWSVRIRTGLSSTFRATFSCVFGIWEAGWLNSRSLSGSSCEAPKELKRSSWEERSAGGGFWGPLPAPPFPPLPRPPPLPEAEPLPTGCCWPFREARSEVCVSNVLVPALFVSSELKMSSIF